MLVVDASAAITACLSDDGWSVFGKEQLATPPLVISEACSALHEARWRGDLDSDTAKAALTRLVNAPIEIRTLDDIAAAWALADELGWAKTYDAEYVVLARSLGCPLVSVDERLKRGVRGRVTVLGPTELPEPEPEE
jgi:predicted nucleic acid-binding protein